MVAITETTATGNRYRARTESGSGDGHGDFHDDDGAGCDDGSERRPEFGDIRRSDLFEKAAKQAEEADCQFAETGGGNGRHTSDRGVMAHPNLQSCVVGEAPPAILTAFVGPVAPSFSAHML